MKNSGLALASLILGILGLAVVWLPGVNFVMHVLAVIFGALAISSIKKRPDELGGRGIAIAGLILGLIGLIPSIILLIVCGGCGVLTGLGALGS